MAARDETTLDTIRHLKRQEPFTPFRIVMVSGDRYLIDNPGALAIAASQLHYHPRTAQRIHLRASQVMAIEEPHENAAG